MKKMKKLISILLVVIIVSSACVTTGLSVDAATVSSEAVSVNAIKTQDEAVTWLKAQNGASYNLDTTTEGTQCTEFVKAYVNWLIKGNAWTDAWGRPTNNGWEVWKNSLWAELGWKVYENTADFLPQPGDIFSSGITKYGHTGVVISSNLNTAVVAEANVDISSDGEYHGSPVRVHTITWKSASSNSPYGATHYIRPNFKPKENKVTNAWVKTSKTRLASGESNTITFGADNATRYDIRIDKDGSLWKYQENVKSGISYTFSDEGSYSVFIAGKNSSSSQDSSKVNFTVYNTLNFGNSFYAYITNVKTGKKIAANSSDNVILSSKDNSNYQKWLFERNSDGTYRITNVERQKCLDVLYADTANGTNIQVYTPNNAIAQQWYIAYNGLGYGLVPKCNTAAAMDIYGGASATTADGTNVQEYAWNGTAAQIFSIDYISLKPSATLEYNGHKYEYYSTNTPWNQAYRYCEKLGGHLVTITSKEENEAVVKLTNGYSGRAWIGSNKVNSKWYWVNGETFSYANWNTGEPNNTDGKENAIDIYVSGDNVGKWNDEAAFNFNVEGFICEYDDIINASDYAPVTSVKYGCYSYELYDYNVDWQTAKKICEKMGGTLATIYDKSENAAITELIKKGTKDEYWIGLSDLEDEGIWKWIDGNYAAYTNWQSDEPNNDYATEEYIAINKASGQWYDLKGYSYFYRSVGFICKKKIELTPSETINCNGHRYEYYNNNMTWNQAYKYCEKLGGHLVTITSKEENELIENLTNGYSGRVWIGSTKLNSTWYWINGETFSYTNWSPGEPNNTNGIEDAIVFYVSGDNTGKWNDNAMLDTNVEGFICEYDDIVDAENYSPVTSVESGGYRYELYDYNVDWQTAKKICEKKGGFLATIYDESENAVIANLIKNGTKNEYWIGLADLEDEGNWRWIDGNYAAYTNWLLGDPNNEFSIEEYTAISKDSGKWYDLKGYSYYYRSVGFICKTPIYKIGDVNSDGVINIDDATEIQKYVAELIEFTDEQKAVADTDGDGIISIKDVTQIQRYVAEYIDKLG